MDSPHPSLDRVFDLLANRRRRYVLYHLADVEAEAVLTVDDVAARIEEWEREWNGAERADEATPREAIRIDLHHNHLPRLADAGLVDYDARTETVRNWTAPPIDRWIRDESNELPRLRALFGVDDSADGDPR